MDKNPTGRFSGLAETYARCRPSYPSDAIDFIIALSGVDNDSLIADIGCGTGISSRLFAERGLKVLGIEPNDDMRQKAEAEEKIASLHYLEGTAEETTLADESVDLIVCAQAFHWFEPTAALAEFKRILKPGGWVALMWNERDENDPFTQMYGDLFRTLPETEAVEMPRGKAGNALLESDLFENRQRDLFISSQILDEDGLVGRAFSASYAPKDEPRRSRFEASLRTLFHAFAESDGSQDGKPAVVTMHYATSIYTGRRL
ncbi:MAG: class I SAM-dependent methyltransferase [Cyanobacteria bacterium SZAS LIN-2]|nr:class I SAM-dependent methyltransferase [Cyanobacteria bacterium SZAS LIN-2]